MLHQSVFLCLSCQGASVVAARPTERSTAAFPTVPPLTVSTPPMSPTTAAPSVGAVSLTSDGNQMFQVQISRFSTSGVSIHSISLGFNSFLALKCLQGTLQDVRFCSEICVNLFKIKKKKKHSVNIPSLCSIFGPCTFGRIYSLKCFCR